MSTSTTAHSTTKHIHFRSTPDISTIEHLPPVDSPKTSTGTATSSQKGFLFKYKDKETPSLTYPSTGYSSSNHASNTINTNQSVDPNLCCYNLPYGLEECPTLNYSDICNNCCSPQKPICSEDPNCHMFKDCRQEVYGETCKYLRGRGPKIPSWLAHCGRVAEIQFN